jgi:hypothetical protein
MLLLSCLCHSSTSSAGFVASLPVAIADARVVHLIKTRERERGCNLDQKVVRKKKDQTVEVSRFQIMTVVSCVHNSGRKSYCLKTFYQYMEHPISQWFSLLWELEIPLSPTSRSYHTKRHLTELKVNTSPFNSKSQSTYILERQQQKSQLNQIKMQGSPLENFDDALAIHLTDTHNWKKKTMKMGGPPCFYSLCYSITFTS